MQVIKEIGQIHKLAKPCIVALGTFDGLHIGHQDVIFEARREARKRECLLAVFTFSNHPLELIRPELVPVKLLTQEKKHSLLAEFGVDLLLDLPFDRKLADLSKDEFLAQLLQLGVSGIVVGENFTYGAGGKGNCQTLTEASLNKAFSLDVRPLVKREGVVISSTVIRKLLKEGKVAKAAELLGRPYTLSGTVAHGNERGRLLGFPTANLELAETTVAVPPEGVYAVRVGIQGEHYQGMANIGKNPTFGDVVQPRLETHIFDFAKDIYGAKLTIEFMDRVRPQVKFASIEQLKQQLARDKATCKGLL